MTPSSFSSRTQRLRVLLTALATAVLPAIVAAQSGGILSADKAHIIVNTPTTLTVRLQLPVNPKLIATSPNLQRFGATGWSLVGSLYDDGTHGDLVAGDNTFTRQIELTEPQIGVINLRASSGYKGSLLRAFSNPLQVNILSPLGLGLTAGSDDVYIVQGSSQNTVSTVNLANSGYGTLNVVHSVSVTPIDGVTLTSDYPSAGWFASDSQSFVLNQKFTGQTPGDYLVVNTASIVGHGITVSDSFVVHVIPLGGDPVILPLGGSPDAIALGDSVNVLFTAGIANFVAPPAQLQLIDMDTPSPLVVGALHDDGLDGDATADDGIYSGFVQISGDAEGTRHFAARGTFPGVVGEKTSSSFGLLISPLPVTVAPSDLSQTAVDTTTGEAVLLNEVLVTFAPSVSSAGIQAFAATFEAEIVGSQAGLGVYQLRIPNPSGTTEYLNTILLLMRNTPGVKSAEANGIVSASAVVPNDPSYGGQYAPQKIRAEEAWVIARGGPLIAVVDTGVDYNHPDLVGRVISGWDFVNADADPMDDKGHGTHVAGIAAALGNNAQGVAGIAWNSKVLAVKVLDSAGSGTSLNVAAGIKYAADAGAKIINCSLGGSAPNVSVESAVNYATAKGSIVVAAAGNTTNTAIGYPGRYANSFCIGSTTSTDSRSHFSCYGPEVDLAAPGSSILSCLVGGGYGLMSGTSMATPCVSGALAVLWSRFPAYTAAQARSRLQDTAVALPGLQLGAGRVDLFEAVFNGSFEDDVEGWSVAGTAGAVSTLGPLHATDRDKFGFASSGPDNAQVETTLEQSFTIQPGVSSFDITFDYNFVTEEYPEWVGSAYNDNMRVMLITPGGAAVELAYESVNGSSFSFVSGIDFPGGDNTTGQTGWKTVSTSVPVTAGPGVYRIQVRDEGDGIYDSNVLIDRIRFR